MSDGQLSYEVRRAAEVTNFSVKHIRRQISANKLRARRSGRKVIIEADELKRWLTSLPTIGEHATAA
jgi:excisionase family DNA binding protein